MTDSSPDLESDLMKAADRMLSVLSRLELNYGRLMPGDLAEDLQGAIDELKEAVEKVEASES